MTKYTILTSSICTTRYTVEADIIDEEFLNFANEYVTDIIEEK